jgi:hypothetical protein
VLVLALVGASAAECAATAYCVDRHPIVAVLGGCNTSNTVTRYDHTRRPSHYRPARSHSRR